MAMISAHPSLQGRLKEADAFLKARRPLDAERVCQEILAAAPAQAEAHLIHARARQMLGRLDAMLESVEAARADRCPLAPKGG